ncbi:hypothetical protein ILUMI_18000 [Ignelater luminosus]|uniref:Metalloendopeptidase n=1 Tax=Ignelater luminosus TaxID=2038154 RepID=A0A8K0CIV7_IGNLU|nr:hypothetical protein ILUMI_18000 [Ignelater luminosus]
MIDHYWPNGELLYEISPCFSKISVFMFFLVFQVVKGQNVWEKSGKFEGDIILRRSRNVMENSDRYWPNGELPYEIASNFNKSEKSIILSTLEFLANKTCLKPVSPREEHEGSILFTGEPGHGCSSTIGYWRKKNQKIYLDRDFGCLDFGTILHEVLHVLGFWHQHSAKDRDKYIEIVLDNVQKGLEYNFNKATHKTDSFGFDYDYESIMHYSAFAFSRNGRKTIIPKRTVRQGLPMGQRKELSEIDILKINKMYNCTPNVEVADDNAKFYRVKVIRIK